MLTHHNFILFFTFEHYWCNPVLSFGGAAALCLHLQHKLYLLFRVDVCYHRDFTVYSNESSLRSMGYYRKHMQGGNACTHCVNWKLFFSHTLVTGLQSRPCGEYVLAQHDLSPYLTRAKNNTISTLERGWREGKRRRWGWDGGRVRKQ